MSVTLNTEPITVDTSLDSIVLVNVLETITGGRSLDVANVTEKVLKAGHVIIKEDATGKHKPMPLNTERTAYGSLPSGHSYAGILGGTLRTDRAMASIVVRGTINEAAAPYPITTAVKTALPLIRFTKD